MKQYSSDTEYELHHQEVDIYDRGYDSDPNPIANSYKPEEEIYGLAPLPDLYNSKLEGEDKNVMDFIAHNIRTYNSLARTEYVKKCEKGEKNSITIQNLADHHDKTIESLLVLKNVVDALQKCSEMDTFKNTNIAETVKPLKNNFVGFEKEVVNVNEKLKTLFDEFAKISKESKQNKSD